MKKFCTFFSCIVLSGLTVALSGCSFFSSFLSGIFGESDPSEGKATFQEHTPAQDDIAKRGVCVSRYNNSTRESAEKINDLKVSWYYNWGCDDVATVKAKGIDAEYVPMIWGGGDSVISNVQKVKAGAQSGDFKYLLTFNEPDMKDQSNLTLSQIISYWDVLEQAGLPLSSPAYVSYDPSVTDNELDQFMTAAKENDCRVDFIALHYYSVYYEEDAVEKILKVLQTVYDRYQLPIWLTEFGAIDVAYNAQNPGSSVSAKDTETNAKKYMTTLLPRMEKLGFVERYSWFLDNFGGRDDAPVNATHTALYTLSDNISALGTAYKAQASSVALNFSTATVAQATRGQSYSHLIRAQGGTGRYTFKATNLPEGLKIAKGGEIYGIPEETGTLKFTVTATDEKGQTISRDYRMKIS